MIQTMQDHIDKEEAAIADGTPIAAADTLLNRVINRITIECQHLESESALKKSRPGSKYSNATSDSHPITKYANNLLGVRCSNCNRRSHDHDHCFTSGGGMAGQGPKGKTPAAKSSTKTAETASVAAENGPYFLNSGEMSCALIKIVPSIESSSSDIAVVTVIPDWATILDSGATSHLIKSHEYFWTYSPENAHQVTTANLGTLRTEASGDFHAVVSFAGSRTCIKLRDCLHSPRACVNLLSVGCFADANITSTFSANSVVLS